MFSLCCFVNFGLMFSTLGQQIFPSNIFQYEDIIYLTDNEKYYLPQQYAIATNDSQPNVSKFQAQNHESLVTEKYRFQIDDIQYDNIFSFLTFDQKFLYICYNLNQKIECHYQIANELNDDFLNVIGGDYLILETNLTSCYKLDNFKENIYLVTCEKSLGQIIQLIDFNSNLLDEVRVESTKNCKISVAFAFGKLLFYEAQTENSTLIIYQIHNNNTFSLFPLKLSVSRNYSGNLISISWRNNHTLDIIFEYNHIVIDLNNENSDIYQTYLWPSNFRAIGYNDNLIYGIKSDLDSQFRISHQTISFSNSSSIPRQLFKRSNFVAMIYKKQILIVCNNIFINTLNIEFRLVIPIGQLPYFVLTTFDGKIIFYQVTSMPQYITWTNTQNTFAYCYPQNSYANQTQYQVLKYSVDNPKIILSDNKTATFILEDNQRNYFDSNQFSYGLPIAMKQFQHNQNYISFIRDTYEIPLTVESFSKVILFNEGKKIIILIQQNETIYSHLYYTESSLLQSIKSPTFQLNFSTIFVSPFNSSFFILKDLSLIQYAFDFQENQFYINFSVQFESQVMQIKQQKDSLVVLFQNCSVHQLNLYTLYFGVINQLKIVELFFTQCTQSIGNNQQIKILYNSIWLFPKSSQSYIRKYKFRNIVDCDSVLGALLIFEVIDNIVAISQYLIDNSELLLLHFFPTYNYQIIYPLRKRITKKYLAIAAAVEHTEAILIYLIKNTVSNKLYKIIKIDKNSQFNFFGENESIYYIHNKQLCIINLGMIEIGFINNKRDTYQEKVNLRVLIQSQIFDEELSTSLSFVLINQIYSLQLRNQNFITYKNRNNTFSVLDLSNIYGHIDEITLINIDNSNCRLITPLALVQKHNFYCLSYNNNICLTSENVISLKIFGENAIIFQINFNILEIIALNYTHFSHYEFLFLDSQKNLVSAILTNDSIMNNSFNSGLDKITIISPRTEFQKLIKKFENLLLFQSESNIGFERFQIIMLINGGIEYIQLNNTYHFKKADIFSINPNDFVCVVQQKKYDDISLIYIHYDQYIIMSKHTSLSSIIFENNEKYYREQIQEFSIIKATKDGLMLKVDIVFFQQFWYGNFYQFSINTQLINQINSEQIYAIRYGISSSLNKILYSSQNLIVLLLNLEDNSKKIAFYDIDSRQYSVIDSYYRQDYDSDAIIRIEKFNETHFTIISESLLHFLIVSLITIDKYGIFCDQYEKSSLMLFIKNDISNITAALKQESEKFQATGEYLIIILLISNFIIITIIIRHTNRSKRLGDITITTVVN